LTVWTEIPRVRFITLCALGAMCVSSLAAAGQSSTGDAPAAKPATEKSTGPGHSTTTKSSSKTHASKKRYSRKKSARVRGQQKIDSERAQAIQEALIREHYLSGEATGTWNQSSEEAMRRYQADHGWQSKTVPDSRALIKLGLGPSKDHLLNPESAMTTVPDAPRAEPMPTTSHSALPTTDPPPAAAPSPTQIESSRPQ
jgi:Putative peptidoglycan binding domain